MTAFVLATALATSPAVWSADAASWWRNLSWFEGQWAGQERGLAGEGQGRRCYGPILDNRFLFMRAESQLRPQVRSSEREHHAQWQIFSRDHDDQRILLRRFGSGGQVVTFVLDTEASRSDRFVFDSAAFDQAPQTAQGRLTLFVGRDNSFRERLELGANADALEQVMEGRWRRIDASTEGCAPAALDF
ncbi:MAG: hypothetical protein JJT88_15415 [Gammaproteobacteria bacterium]|nr:hypothetical protein [Gammaproteobacteria bacterium]